MITDGLVKHEFVVQTLQWGLDKLRKAQISQLNAKVAPIVEAGFDWEALLRGVAGRQNGIIGSNGHYRVDIPVDKHLRFADMKKLGVYGHKGPNAMVYNRPTWGVLFGRDDSVRTRLRQGMNDAIRQTVLESLQAAFNLESGFKAAKYDHWEKP